MSAPATALTEPPAPNPPSQATQNTLIAEVQAFKADSERRYRFNSRCDNGLNIFGLLLSVAIIAAGVYEMSKLATILGGLVAAVVSAQRAFPVAQRVYFYRSMMSQSANLMTEINAGTVTLPHAIDVLKSLRLDFALQLPRGSNFSVEPGSKPRSENGPA
jgi:hypothetical protein